MLPFPNENGNRQFLVQGVLNIIYIIYTPNLGLRVAVPGQKREQGRSSEGAREHRGSKGPQHKGA